MAVRRPKGAEGSKVLPRKGRLQDLFREKMNEAKVVSRKRASSGTLQPKGWDGKVGPAKKWGRVKGRTSEGPSWGRPSRRQNEDALRLKRIVAALAIMAFLLFLFFIPAWSPSKGSGSGFFYVVMLGVYAVIHAIGGKHDKS
jgi:hypothetical protein